MRRYRYGDPKSTKARTRVIGQVLKFFIGWNIMGYCIWRYLKSAASKQDPRFDQKSSAEQVLQMIGYKENAKQPTKYRLKIGSGGFSLRKEDEDTSADSCDKKTEDTNSEGSPKN